MSEPMKDEGLSEDEGLATPDDIPEAVDTIAESESQSGGSNLTWIMWLDNKFERLCTALADALIESEALRGKVERLTKKAGSEFQRGVDEGASCQAKLELQGRDRFINEQGDWRRVVHGCEKILDCPDRSESALQANLPNIIRDKLIDIGRLQHEVERLEALLAAYREARRVDGLDGRTWSALAYRAASDKIDTLELPHAEGDGDE